jgi:hypothetical protein
MAMPLETVIVVAFVIFAGYTIFGATGFGASPITIPVLAHLLPVPVRNLIGTRLTLRRRSERTSGPAVSAVGGLGAGSPGERPPRRGAEPTGQVRQLADSGSEGRGRARPRSGDALVAVMEPADLGNGVDPAA